MSLQFVLGSSGSGKTEYLFRQVVTEAGQNPKKDYLVLVPEQFTMETQQKLVDLSPGHAIMNIDVLSFGRLAYRVFDELGIKNLRVLEETGKNLILRKLADEMEEQLTVLRPNIRRMGYIGQVKSLISEFMQYHLSCEDILAMSENSEVTNVLSAKLKDLAVMYGAFLEYLKDSYITAEEILSVLISVAPDSGILKDSVIVLDEFTGFTPIQNALIRELLPLCDRILISLSMDVREDYGVCRGKEELFALTKETILSLTKMAGELHVQVEKPVLLEHSEKKRFLEAPELAHLEQNLFRMGAEKYTKDVQAVRLYYAKNPQEELCFVANKIHELITRGYRYRDIAVVTGAMETYQDFVEPLFLKYGIPYFMDTTRALLHHPFITFLRASLAVIEENFSYQAVMRFLRCGFLNLEEEEIDRLDNYLLATGIRGKAAFRKRFNYRPRQERWFDADLVEQLRCQMMEVLSPLLAVFEKKDATVREGLVALTTFLIQLDMEQKLSLREQELLHVNEQKKAKEYAQVYPLVMQLLEKYDMLFSEEKLEISSFIEVLEAGLSETKVASIPPGYDCVMLGDIERTRLNHIKILFFVGVNDGVVPKSGNAGGILSEYERELLLEQDYALAPGTKEQAFIQKFYLYRNLTKPSQKLYISYHTVDGDGKGARPSYLIGAVRKLFPKLTVTAFDRSRLPVSFSSPEAAFDYLLYHPKDDLWFALAKYFLSEGGMAKERFEGLMEASFATCRVNGISPGVARVLYGQTPVMSVTRLERFASCAYAHYLQYGLRLLEREKSEFTDPDIGNLYHTALERYSKKISDSPYDWFMVPDEVRKEYSDSAMEEAILAYPSVSLFAQARTAYQLERMKAIFRQTVWALTKQVRAGRFVPTDFEVSFSRMEGISSLQVDLAEDVHMRLQGRIDRLDTCVTEQGLSVKIIDYKSGSADFQLLRVYHGLQLQLVVYLNAAMEMKKREKGELPVLPGGILYYHIDEPLLESATEEELLSKLRPDGLINREESIYGAMDEQVEGRSLVIPLELKKDGTIFETRSHVASTEEFEVLTRYVENIIRQQGTAIYQGDIRINPYQSEKDCSCDFCPYSGICGIHGRLPGQGYRKLKHLTKEEVFERMQTENAKWKRKEDLDG